MVNTVMLWIVALAILVSVAFVTASEKEQDLDTTTGGTTNDTNILRISVGELDFVKEDLITERKGCRATDKCILFGGFCVKSYACCDGMVDYRGCRGRRCKCCIPVPTCPTTTDIPITKTTDMTTPTPTVSETTQVPCGFEVFQGRQIRRTISSDTKSNYDGCMSFCDQCGAKPFIPRTEEDYQLYKDVRHSLGDDGYMWLPANDRLEEGSLRWENGEVVSDTSLWEWANGVDLASNTDSWDCLFYGRVGGIPAVHLIGCNAFISYPPICEINTP